MRTPRFWWDKPGALSALLSPLGAIYGAVAAKRLSQEGERAGAPVICIGNPTVGGAGKTPAAIAIARMLLAKGQRPMFLTRGYGGRLAGPVTVESGHTATQVGDEPLLLARVAPTVVAHNRAAGARHAVASGASVIVMDDGFQNPTLAKDLSILVIDAARGVGNGHALPAGPLRAPLAPQIARAQAVLMVGDGPDIVSGLPVFHARLEPDRAALAALAGQRVLAFAGIGNPGKFFATLAAAGIDAPVTRAFPDHHRFMLREARDLLREADRQKLTLLTTEKDLVRLQGDAQVTALAGRTRALPVELFVKEADAFAALIEGALRPQAPG